MLYFNPDKFDFWKIYDSIKEFYPIGIFKEENGLFFSYPGMKELEGIIVDNIHNDSHFKTRWDDLDNEIRERIEKPIVGTTYGQAPSFSSFIQLDRSKFGNVTRSKELHFFISLIGPYYSIVGQENFSVEIDDRNFRSTNHLVVSPENEFAATFGLLCEKIESRFQNYRFVPFDICRQTIAGLNVRYSDNQINSIFNALFNNHIDLRTQILGDDFYKAEDWIKSDWVDDGGEWEVIPPGTR